MAEHFLDAAEKAGPYALALPASRQGGFLILFRLGFSQSPGLLRNGLGIEPAHQGFGDPAVSLFTFVLLVGADRRPGLGSRQSVRGAGIVPQASEKVLGGLDPGPLYGRGLDPCGRLATRLR